MSAKPTALTRHPIYQELMAIGRVQKTIRPEALTSYPYLLASSEVRRRAGIDATVVQIAGRASEALQDAIANIVSTDNRTVAEAALCSRKKFEGKQISERLSELPGMTDDIFRYRRRQAFESIIQYLNRDNSKALNQVPLGATEKRVDRQSVGELLEVDLTKTVSDASTLYYAGLAVMFLADFDWVLREHRVPTEREPGEWFYPLTVYWLRANTRLLYRLYSPDMHSEKRSLWRPDRFLEECGRHPHFKNFPTNELVGLWNRVGELTPPRLYDPPVSGEQGVVFENVSRGDLSLVSGDLFHELDKWLSFTSARKATMKRERRDPDPLRDIIAAANSLSQTLNRQITIVEPVFSRARRRAQKAIATCYGFDDWTPVLNGKSLRQYVEVYFDSDGAALTEF